MIFNYILSKITGKILIPKKLLIDEVKVLHITDTPLLTFNNLKKLINEIQPEYIIHTGDLVDNIKLELFPKKIKEYKREVKKMIDILENSSSDNVYIVLGNHDDKKTVKKYINKVKIMHNNDVIEIEGKKFLIAHNPDYIIKKENVDYILHGHNYSDEFLYDKDKYFNGLKYIYIFYPKINKYFKLNYPIGTDDSRLQKYKIGI